MAKRRNIVVSAANGATEPARRTGATYRIVTSYPGNRPAYVQRVDPTDHYARSQLNLERIPRRMLRAFADTLPAQTAIKRIVDGIVQMPFAVNPPKEDKDKEPAQKQALLIAKALRRPNSMEHKTWGQFVSAIVNEMLIMGLAPVERRQSTAKNAEQPFWLWSCNSDYIVPNPAWSPQVAGVVPRYFDISLSSKAEGRVELLDSEMFMLQQRCNTWQLIPPSPLETAFKMISAWLGLTEYQQTTTSHVSQEQILFLGEITERQYDAFKEFWRNDVENSGQLPILAGKGKPEVIKVGANNDAGLYLAYGDFLLKMIALAFLLRAQDVNIEKETNFATAGISADASFQFAMVPTARAIIDSLQVEVVDRYFPGYTIELSDMEKRSESDEATIANTLFAGNISTQNEARMRVGLPSLGAVGEHFFDGSTGEEAPMKRQLIDEAHEQPPDGQTQNNGKGQPNGKVPPPNNQKVDPKKTAKAVPVKATQRLLPRPVKKNV